MAKVSAALPCWMLIANISPDMMHKMLRCNYNSNALITYAQSHDFESELLIFAAKCEESDVDEETHYKFLLFLTHLMKAVSAESRADYDRSQLLNIDRMGVSVLELLFAAATRCHDTFLSCKKVLDHPRQGHRG